MTTTKAVFTTTDKANKTKAEFDGLQAPTQIKATTKIVDKKRGNE